MTEQKINEEQFMRGTKETRKRHRKWPTVIVGFNLNRRYNPILIKFLRVLIRSKNLDNAS